jgi:hypothetical protein
MAGAEWRYDFSYQPFFHTSKLNVLKGNQLSAKLAASI